LQVLIIDFILSLFQKFKYQKMKLRFVFCYSVLLILTSCKKDSPETKPGSPLDNGMIAYYPFDGSANDHSGNNYHLTVTAATLSADRFGKSSNAYSFNGTGAFMTIPNYDIADSIDNFTISLWAKPIMENGQAYLISLSTPSAYTHSIQLIRNTNSYQSWIEIVRCTPGTSLCSYQYSTQSLPDTIHDQWTHIVVGQNNSSPFLYVNGQELFVPGLHYAPISFANGGTIGSANSGSSGFFKGDLDDIRIYNRMLSREEIQQLFSDKP